MVYTNYLWWFGRWFNFIISTLHVLTTLVVWPENLCSPPNHHGPRWKVKSAGDSPSHEDFNSTYPLVNVYIAMENHHVLWQNSLISMAIFHSDVNLPEGIYRKSEHFFAVVCILTAWSCSRKPEVFSFRNLDGFHDGGGTFSGTFFLCTKPWKKQKTGQSNLLYLPLSGKLT